MVNERCIATAADAKYFPALIALLRSLRRTNPHIPVVVFDGGLEVYQKKKASRLARVIAKSPSIRIPGRGKFSYIGDATLLKFEAHTLPYEKALFLDADMIVLDKLDALFDFPELSVGAVPEVNSVKNMFRPRHRRRLMESIDIEWEGRGFNAGLFALRPAEWPDLPDRARDLVARFGEEAFSKTKDQQLLNVIFSGRVHPFPGRYNFSPFYDDCDGNPAPAVIHYLTGCKPWHYGYPDGKYYSEFRRHISVGDHPGIALVELARVFRKAKKHISRTA